MKKEYSSEQMQAIIKTLTKVIINLRIRYQESLTTILIYMDTEYVYLQNTQDNERGGRQPLIRSFRIARTRLNPAGHRNNEL